VTEARYGDVDLDRLADYIGGALDGTADEQAVSELISTDPQWATAYSALVQADSAVRADLAVLAAAPDPIPADVAARLDQALGADPSGRRLGVVRDDSAPAGAGTPVRLDQRRRTRRWTAVAAAAAALVIGVFGTVTVLSKLGGANSNKSATSAGAPARGSQQDNSLAVPPATGGGTSPELLASGTDYGPGSFRNASGNASTIAPLAPGIQASPRPNEVQPGQAVPDAVPDELRPLTAPTAREACLAAIVAEYGGTVTLVDYARFQGRPALVVVLTDAKGRSGSWIVVVGPSCGTGGAIADERYNGPAQ
jgi:hypothetical protein